MLGNYQPITPDCSDAPGFITPMSDAAWNTLGETFAYITDRFNIDPLGSTWKSSLNDTRNNISGHRDMQLPGDFCTCCPGDNIYNRLGELRQDVKFKVDACNGIGGGAVTPIGCTPSPRSNTYWEYIDNLIVAGWGTIETGDNGGYYKHNSTINLRTGWNYIWVQPEYPTGYEYDETYRVWIDYNNNGRFEQSEQVSYTNNTGGAWLIFEIPSANLGRTFNMRVREEYTFYAGPVETDACKTVEGEVEDYIVYIASGKNDEPDLTQYETKDSGSSFPISPNPIASGGKASFSDDIFRGDDPSNGNYQLQIVSTDGKVLKSYTEFEVQNRSVSIDLPELNPGLYFFNLNNTTNRMNVSGSFIVIE